MFVRGLLKDRKMLRVVVVVLPLFLVALTASAIANTQTLPIEWEKTFGGTETSEEAWCVQQTRNGGYIIAGHKWYYALGSGDAYLAMTEADGHLLWEKTFGGTDDDWFTSVKQTADGGYIMTGTVNFSNLEHEDPQFHYPDVYLVKTDGYGLLEWYRTLGGSGDDRASSVQQTRDGGYIVAGRTTSFGAGDRDVYLVKVDANGNLQWNRNYGGEGFDEGHSVIQTSDGGYIIAGETMSYGDFIDAYLVRTDADGNLQWNKTFGGARGDIFNSVQQSSDGGYIIAGTTGSFSASYDAYLVKTNDKGNLTWEKTFGGTETSEEAWCVQQTRNGGYILAGISTNAYLIKTDGDGNLQWQQTYGGIGDYRAYYVQQTHDGGYIIAGSSRPDAFPDTNVYLIKLAPKKLSIKLSGEFDYLLNEPVRIRLAALVGDAETMEPVSGARVKIQIYDDKGLIYSSVMKEKIDRSGIYEWTSSRTIKELNLKKGVYLVRAQASYEEGPMAQDMLLFHIDPPPETDYEIPLYIVFTAVVSAGITVLILRRREIIHRIRTYRYK